MQGSSRSALTAARQVLGSTLSGPGDAMSTARELFAAVDVIDNNATLRRALADPTRTPEAKGSLVERLFSGKVNFGALQVLKSAAGQRWSTDRDMTDAIERLAVEATTASAENDGVADAFENQVFRFERTVAADEGLRDALSDRTRSGADKAGLVTRLLDGKVTPQAQLLVTRAAEAPRGRRFDRTVEEFLTGVASRRGQSQAVVTSAIELTEGQTMRLRNALSKMYGKTVQTNVVIDPEVVGGIKVKIGDDVIDGTIARRLEEARTHLSG